MFARPLSFLDISIMFSRLIQSPISRRQIIQFGVVSMCLYLAPSLVLAGTTFGIYDARTLAMGSTSVASANNGNGQFYNAALLAFNEDIEERTQDGRFYLPLFVPQLSESTINLEELFNDDPEQAISRAISSFNASPDTLTAQAVADASGSFNSSLAKLNGEDLYTDFFVGMGGGEAGKHRGAGFFFGVRFLAGGQSSISAADLTLLAAYEEGLTFVASNGLQGVAHPELFDANGALLDPGNNFDSSASAIGAVLSEAGVAMSRQFSFFGEPIAAGISLKVQTVDTFEDVERIVDDRIDVDQNGDYDAKLNFDLGFAKEIGDHWRVGLAIKDVIPRNYRTSRNTIIRLRPRARIGAALKSGRFLFTADADVTQNVPIGTESPTQEIAVGAEWDLDLPIQLRAGFRHDILGHRAGIASVGVGTLWRRIAVDIAVAGSSDTKAAALQMGIAF